MSSKIMLIFLVYASSVHHFASSTVEEKHPSQKDLRTLYMKVNEKFNFLDEKVEKLEFTLSTINNTMEQNAKKMTKIEGLLLALIEKIDDQKISKREAANEFKSQCNSMCESQVNIWVNQTSNIINGNLKKLDFCLNHSTSLSEQNVFTACDINPCINGGQCKLASYYCAKCPYPTTGRHCENLNCNKANRCFQYQNSMYVVLDENVLWNEAYNRCLSNGMRLAMPKDRDTTEFLVNQLRSVYGVISVYFWMGLRNNGTEEWRWMDGSPLGNYVGNYPNFKTFYGESWGIMYLDGKSALWAPRVVKAITNGPHHSLCEKQISVRFN